MANRGGHIILNEYATFTKSWLYLAKARLLTLLLPFRSIVKLVNKPLAQPNSNRQIAVECAKVKIAIHRACKKSPWRTRCLEQALAAHLLLRNLGIASVITIGVRKDERGTFRAHAWLDCQGIRITGGNSDGFKALACLSP